MSGRGKGGSAGPLLLALSLDDSLYKLGQDRDWAQDKMGEIEANRNLDPAGYAKQILDRAMDRQGYPGGLSEALAVGETMSPEERLAYLMAVSMRGDRNYRWTKDAMHTYVNSLISRISTKQISKAQIDKWIKMHFDPAWEPRTQGQRPGRVVGNPMAAEQHLLRNIHRLRHEHDIIDTTLDQSREIADGIYKDGAVNEPKAGLADRVVEALVSDQAIGSEAVQQEAEAYKRAVKRIIHKTARVTPHSLPEDQELPETTRVLFALIGDRFNESLLRTGAYRYADNAQVTGKEAEEWWRETMEGSLGMPAGGLLKRRAINGIMFKVVPEHSGTGVYDLVVTIQEPGRRPFHLTLQFKSYQDESTDPSSTLHICKLGNIRGKNKKFRPRTGKELAEEISVRMHTTNGFANISVDPTREGRKCDLRRADKVVHRAECLHPRIQEALTQEELARHFRRRKPGGHREAKIKVRIAGETVEITLTVSKGGAVTLSGLTNPCWIPINTSTFLTETGARADGKLLGRILEEEREAIERQNRRAYILDSAFQEAGID